MSIIGFACTRTPHTSRSFPAHTAVRATPAPAVSVAIIAPHPATAAPMHPASAPPAASAGTATTIAGKPNAAGRPATPHSGARLALIIDDCGQWLDTERGFIALPVSLTLSVLPDVRFNHTIEREAADNNKGVMLHLPMETISGVNPGPGKVTTEMGDAAIATQVEHDLGDVDLAMGVNNHEGSKATTDTRVMNDVMVVLARRGRFFIDSRTNRASVAMQVASEHGVATARRDVFIDNVASIASTETQLRAAAAIARRDGSAIAIGHPRPTTLAAVRAMIPELRADGITFIRASDLVR